MSNPAPGGVSLIDGHAHVRPCFGVELALASAVSNFTRAAAELHLEAGAVNWLLLCETTTDEIFHDSWSGRIEVPNWRFDHTAEECSLIARRGDGAELVIVAGRQIQTAEGLEILAWGYHRRCADGAPLRQALQEVLDARAIAVLPWGFGKWTFGRRAVMRRLLRADPPLGFHLADSGNRARRLSPSRLLRDGASRGILNLPGSGVLPFQTEARRLASFGFVLRGGVDRATPFAGLRALIAGQNEQPQLFGSGLPLLPFCAIQLRAQARKRLGPLWSHAIARPDHRAQIGR